MNLFAILKKVIFISEEEHRYRGTLRYLPHAYLDGGYAKKDMITELRTVYESHSGYDRQNKIYVGEVQMFEIACIGQWVRRFYRFSHHDLQKVIDTCENVMEKLNDEEFHNINISVVSGAEKINREVKQ